MRFFMELDLLGVIFFCVSLSGRINVRRSFSGVFFQFLGEIFKWELGPFERPVETTLMNSLKKMWCVAFQSDRSKDLRAVKQSSLYFIAKNNF